MDYRNIKRDDRNFLVFEIHQFRDDRLFVQIAEIGPLLPLGFARMRIIAVITLHPACVEYLVDTLTAQATEILSIILV